MPKTVLLTGAAGMIGSQVVTKMLAAGHRVVGLDKRESHAASDMYTHIVVDLADEDALERVFVDHEIDRVIHLAALAHTAGAEDLSYAAYYHANVVCAEVLFKVSASRGIPVLLISTADVYGFAKDRVNGETEPKPVTVYGKTKYLAENALKETCPAYDIYRFAPVYTDEVKRDIQKRYYFKYPNWAYIVGNGLEYEFLYIGTAADRLARWVDSETTNKAYNVKDEETVNTSACLQVEKQEGRAKHILHFPRWLIRFGFGVIYCLTGKNKYTYLLNKAVHPLRTE